MRLYKVPFDIKREEKIFGGYLSLRQVLYLMCSVASFSVFAMPIPKLVKITFATILALFFVACSFLKLNEQNFDKFFFYAIKYLLRKKSFVYRRCTKW